MNNAKQPLTKDDIIKFELSILEMKSIVLKYGFILFIVLLALIIGLYV